MCKAGGHSPKKSAAIIAVKVIPQTITSRTIHVLIGKKDYTFVMDFYQIKRECEYFFTTMKMPTSICTFEETYDLSLKFLNVCTGSNP